MAWGRSNAVKRYLSCGPLGKPLGKEWEGSMKVVLQNLTKKFPGRGKNKTDEVIAVNDFTFEIPDGKLIGLLGPSGCGKST